MTQADNSVPPEGGDEQRQAHELDPPAAPPEACPELTRRDQPDPDEELVRELEAVEHEAPGHGLVAIQYAGAAAEHFDALNARRNKGSQIRPGQALAVQALAVYQYIVQHVEFEDGDVEGLVARELL